MTEQLFTWGTLGTYAGAVLFTSMLTQLLKNVGFLKNIRTRLVSYVIALLVLIAATVFGGTPNVESIALCFINAFVVSFAAQGSFDAVSAMAGGRKSTRTR